MQEELYFEDFYLGQKIQFLTKLSHNDKGDHKFWRELRSPAFPHRRGSRQELLLQWSLRIWVADCGHCHAPSGGIDQS
jgi:hypothetical protein